MPTVTRTQIKAVENRMRGRLAAIQGFRSGMRGLGDWTDIFGGSGTSQTPPISGTQTNGQIQWSDFMNMLRGGQLKIEATQFVEGMNRLFFGMEPGCTNPVPNIPVVPNNPTPKFCSSSVAGMIERCRTTEASTGLQSIVTQFQQRMSNPNDQTGVYIRRWWQEYGQNNISNLTATIANARGACGVTGDIPKLCTSPQTFCTPLMKCVYPGECPSVPGGNTTTIMMIAAMGLLAMMLMRR